MASLLCHFELVITLCGQCGDKLISWLQVVDTFKSDVSFSFCLVRELAIRGFSKLFKKLNKSSYLLVIFFWSWLYIWQNDLNGLISLVFHLRRSLHSWLLIMRFFSSLRVSLRTWKFHSRILFGRWLMLRVVSHLSMLLLLIYCKSSLDFSFFL